MDDTTNVIDITPPEQEVDLPTMTLQELAKKTAELKKTLEDKESQIKFIKEQYDGACTALLGMLDAMELDSFKGFGFTFYKQVDASVKTPKTLEEKQALFQYLQEKGIFEEMVSINSQTLNRLYKDLSEQAAKEGVLDFRLPGVGEPSFYPKLKLRKI